MMSSPPRPSSPSPSTPSSGDEEPTTAAGSQTSPHPKRRAVAPSGADYPQPAGKGQRPATRSRDERGKNQGLEGRSGSQIGNSAFNAGPKEELADIALRDELRQIIGDPLEQ